MHRPAASFLVFVVVTILLAAIAAACAPASAQLPTAAAPSAVPGASASSASAGSPGPAPSGVSADPAVAWPAFAACLRAHGADVPDPQIDSDGNPRFPANLDIKAILVAQPTTQQDCAPLLALVTETKGGSSHSYSFESLLAHAACLREHGLPDYPDPNPNEEARLAPGYDKADPNVNAALVACQHVLVEGPASPGASQ
jgi:hypothetical protein